MEEWKDIKGYEGLYQVSNEGRIKRLAGVTPRGIKGDLPIKEHFLNGYKSSNKHIVVELQGKPFYIHQLVAEAFVPNTHGYTVVHHKDHNPDNNNSENLLWMDDLEHRKHHAKTIGENLSKKVCQCTLDGELVKIWDRMIDAARSLGINQGSISNCCNGRCNW